MAHVLRPLIQWPRWRHHRSTLSRLLAHHSPLTLATASPPFFAFFAVSDRAIHFRYRARKLRDAPVPSDVNESDEESSDGGGARKSRNERKRDARRAVRWGMDLATFSPAQIRRILRVAAVEQEVFDALILVKRLGHDVREGKRRQYNYIGKLLREVEPELMDSLILATKDGDQGTFNKLAGPETLNSVDEEEEEEEIVEEDEEEDSMNVPVVTRWYDGLINKNINITNEIYSLRGVEFDRQELRQLVRKVHSTLEYETSLENTGVPDAAALDARKSLTRFLQNLAKQLPAKWAMNE